MLLVHDQLITRVVVHMVRSRLVHMVRSRLVHMVRSSLVEELVMCQEHTCN